MTAARKLDPDRLAKALRAADLRVLLMVLYHMTGDECWLQPPYRPRRDVMLIADPAAGFAPDLQQAIRAAALEVLGTGRTPALSDPGDTRMLRMMRACLAEKVPAEYAPMMREEVGFVSRFANWSPGFDATRALAGRRLRVGIVGAGAAGIALGANLIRLGIDFTIFERAADVGGTWRDHRYPGCGVDTPNHAYSFSFGSRYPWSRYFAPRDQLFDYMRGVAAETGVTDHVRFNTTVCGATWDAASRSWSIALEGPDGPRHETVDIFVSAIGQLSEPVRLRIRGEETFPGQIFHPMHWPEGLDHHGKSVAVIGSGASSMQIVSEIAGQVGDLTIYQRTPQWARAIPRYHDPIDDDQQWLLREVPFYAEWFRLTMLWRYGDGLLPTLKRDPDWPHPTRSVNATNERHRVEMVRYIEQKLAGRPDLIAASTPDYPPYGKRILLDAGWYDALLRDNVELVGAGIDHIDGDLVVTRDGRQRRADIIVVSTGYDVNRLTSRLNVRGKDGLDLRRVWGDDNPTAYKSLTVPGFPNMFIIYGPNTGLAHGGSAIFMNECGARYVADFIRKMVEQGIASAEARAPLTEAYTGKVDAEHESLVWTAPGLASYYRNSVGRVTSANPWRLVDFWSQVHDADPENYDLDLLSTGDPAVPATAD